MFNPYNGKPTDKVELDPDSLDVPRYCSECGRRMVVQVRPDSWTARCSRHGEIWAGEI
ncbi:hypothetical protein [Corynebacterium sp.]|uniref:biotin synthase auxiliary protein BsaP n=1 Tax=Corynebacterium sp. TaxID=1720 RepID=UPI0026DCCBF5|nr:hypothetical protein [Corynebacterium sp.]MDO5032605.1 hypothetical protein [Corynebacterium sp.]